MRLNGGKAKQCAENAPAIARVEFWNLKFVEMDLEWEAGLSPRRHSFFCALLQVCCTLYFFAQKPLRHVAAMSKLIGSVSKQEELNHSLHPRVILRSEFDANIVVAIGLKC